jgi:hypothetical protein
MACTAELSIRAPLSGQSLSASTPNASASRASPAWIAGFTPKTRHAVGRCRRVGSPSITSSCSSEWLCTSSIATAAGSARAPLPPTASAASRVRAGRSALPALASLARPRSSHQPKW